MTKQHLLNFMIIGQGLAGSLLAWRLIEAGQSVLVIDNGNESSASKVAAGLLNPVTGKRLVKDPAVEIYLAAAHDCYQQLAVQFGQPFLHEKAMLRLIDSEAIRTAWHKRLADPTYQPFLDRTLGPDETGYPRDGFVQRQTGYLATGAILDSLRNWLIEKKAYVQSQFDYNALQLGDVIQWQEYHAERVIFCEGAGVANNPWFAGLPMQPAKGEILTLQTDSELPEWIINAGHWLLPLEQGHFKLGATYVWPSAEQPLDETITETGKEQLLASLPNLFPDLQTYQLIKQAAGIRPNSKDKRPLLGFHPEQTRLAVFNGFGSRGSTLIPYYSHHFVDVLLKGVELEADVNITRVN